LAYHHADEREIFDKMVVVGHFDESGSDYLVVLMGKREEEEGGGGRRIVMSQS